MSPPSPTPGIRLQVFAKESATEFKCGPLQEWAFDSGYVENEGLDYVSANIFHFMEICAWKVMNF